MDWEFEDRTSEPTDDHDGLSGQSKINLPWSSSLLRYISSPLWEKVRNNCYLHRHANDRCYMGLRLWHQLSVALEDFLSRPETLRGDNYVEVFTVTTYLFVCFDCHSYQPFLFKWVAVQEFYRDIRCKVKPS